VPSKFVRRLPGQFSHFLLRGDAAIKSVPSDEGTIVLITNCARPALHCAELTARPDTGDNLHFGLAVQQMRVDGVKNIEIIPCADDVAVYAACCLPKECSSPPQRAKGRRSRRTQSPGWHSLGGEDLGRRIRSRDELQGLSGAGKSDDGSACFRRCGAGSYPRPGAQRVRPDPA
jgi:hypothetical protein